MGAILPPLVAGGYAMDHNRPMNEELESARAKVEKEYKKVAESIAEVHVAFHDVKNADLEADIYGLLDTLEKTVHKARTGGVVGSGAKGHRKALAEYHELLNPSAEG
jgi:hypothetical protein